MTVQIIPTLSDGSSFYEQTTDLDGTTYQLHFHYNSVDEHWYLDLRTEAGDEIQGCSGMKLVQGGFPLRRVYDELRPPGELFVSSESKDEPGLETLGEDEDTVLTYIPLADVEEAFPDGV